MANKNWGYMIRIFLGDDAGNPVEEGRFEAEEISPYKLLTGPYREDMKSKDFDSVPNAMAVGDFIRWIGDSNTLSVKKLKDSTSIIMKEAKRDDETLYGIRLEVAPLAKIPPTLRGKPRIEALYKYAIESVQLTTTSVTAFWSVIHVKGKSQTQYDYITFEAEKVRFNFKGMEPGWK